MAVVTAAIASLSAVAEAQDNPPVVPLPEVKVDAPPVPRYVPDRTSVGTKTDTPLMDVPATVQSVPRELLYDQGAFTLDGIIRNVSGVQQSGNSNYGFFSTYSIRGLASQFYRDGVLDASQVNGYLDTDRRCPRGHSQGARLRPLRQRSARRHHQPDLQAPDAHAVLQRHGRRGQLRDLPVRDGPGRPSRRDPGLSLQQRLLPHERLPRRG